MPGDREDRLRSATGRGADALILDLEDSVGHDAKGEARRLVASRLAEPPDGLELWVRINATSLTEDVAAVAAAPLRGFVLPKAERDTVAAADAALFAAEQRLALPAGRFRMLALVETARGMLEATQVASAARVDHLGIGEADLIAELRLRPSEDRAELAPLRLQVVLASAAAGIAAPVAPTSTDFRDLDAFRRTSERLLALGFRGRTAIHPGQVAVINDVFTPRPAEVEEARRLLERFQASSSGVAIDDHGRMVDEAVVRSAREVLARAGWASPPGLVS